MEAKQAIEEIRVRIQQMEATFRAMAERERRAEKVRKLAAQRAAREAVRRICEAAA